MFIFNTNKTNHMFLLQFMYSWAAKINMCAGRTLTGAVAQMPCKWHWQDPLVNILKFCSFGHWRPYQLPEGDIWLMFKHIGWTGTILVKIRKQEKDMAMRMVCKHQEWLDQMNLACWKKHCFWKLCATGNRKTLKEHHSAQLGKWRSCVRITQSCYRSTLSLHLRGEVFLALRKNTSVAPRCLELWVTTKAVSLPKRKVQAAPLGNIIHAQSSGWEKQPWWLTFKSCFLMRMPQNH